MTIKKIRGTRDLFPLTPYTNLYNNLQLYLILHNFQEIHTPIFEFESLFTKNLGISTDIVNKEMYTVSHKHASIEENKGTMVLRPELTAAMMRAYFENNIQNLPTKLFQIGPVFRHERPQKGRYREFFQCSIEIINCLSIGYDLQLLIALDNFFSIHLKEGTFQLEINFLGSITERESYKKALYNYCIKKKNYFPKQIQEKLSENSILRILENTNEEVIEILQDAPLIFEYLNQQSIDTWSTITNGLKEQNILYKHNTKLVRGLDYYNNLIFEFTSCQLGAQNAFCGGGRYDTLSLNFNNKIIPSLGAGIGLDRLLILQELIQNNKNERFFIPILFNNLEIEKNSTCAFVIQNILVKNNIETDIYFDKTSLKSALKKAHNENAIGVIILDEASIQYNTCIVKNMSKEYHQEVIAINDQFITYIKYQFNIH